MCFQDSSQTEILLADGVNNPRQMINPSRYLKYIHRYIHPKLTFCAKSNHFFKDDGR